MNQKGIKTKQMILEKSYLIFAKKGFKDVTMKDICEKTGLSRGGLYRHFDSTKQIFEEILSSLLNAQNESFEQQIDEGISASIILNKVLEKYRSEMLDHSASLSIALYEYYSLENHQQTKNNPALQQYHESELMWQKLIEYGIKKSEFNKVDSKEIISLIIFSYQGVRMFSQIMPINENIPDGIIKQIQTLLIMN